MSQREKLDALYLEALEVEANGDVVTALTMFMEGAALGDGGAMNAVGLAYDSGAGVEKNKETAIVWFKKAWRTEKQSYLCINIALTYAQLGRHRPAMYWWRKALATGDGTAALSLAKYLMKSKGRKPRHRTLELLRMAATCHAPLDISPADKEEAQKLLKRFTAKGS
jgi:TPR repeat protein